MLILLAAAGSAQGQVSINLRLNQDTFLLYESIPAVLSIRNFSGRAIEMTETEDESWLHFMVTDENNGVIAGIGKAKLGGALLIGPGQTVSRTVDLLPLYELRARGNYRVQAQVTSGGVSVISQTEKFTIMQGRELARITTGLPARGEEGDEFRTYALVTHAARQAERLFLSVSEDKKGQVYPLISLGMRIPIGDPELLTDRNGDAHVLFQNGPRSFGYVRVGPKAEVNDRAVYTDTLTKPMLVIQEGVVSVRGGEKVLPKSDRMMTKEELTPPPAPPATTKKHWWWPFGSRASTTNSPTAAPQPRKK